MDILTQIKTNNIPKIKEIVGEKILSKVSEQLQTSKEQFYKPLYNKINK